MTAYDLFAEAARRTPDAIALDGTTTYAQLELAAGGVASALQRAGVKPGAVVAVLAGRDHHFVEALLGVMQAGAAFAVLDPAYPAQRLAQMARACRPTALLAAVPVPRELEEVAPRIALPVEAARCSTARPRELAYVAFTSGTTGKPKAILGPHGPLPHFLRWHAATWGFTARDRFAMLSGLSHDPVLRDVFTPLSIGASLHIPPQEALRDPLVLRAFLRERDVSVVHLTPSLARVLCHGAESGALPALRHAFFGGEPLLRPVADELRRVAPMVRSVNFYGATETPQAIAFHELTDADPPGRVPVGRGIEGVELLVEDGEVCVRTQWLALGYLDDPEETRRKFVGGMYRTGDRGRVLKSGEVDVVGRGDAQVKIRGFRVEPAEIEAALAAHASVERAIVIARDDALYAYAQVRREVTSAALRRHLAQLLPDYMVPRAVVLVESFPLTPSGKLDLRALPEPPADKSVSAYVFDGTERLVAEAFAEALDVASVSRSESFFELGGDSFSALLLTDALERRLGRRVAVNALLRDDTVEKLARALRAEPAPSARQKLLVEIEPDGSRPPVYWIPGGGGLSVLAFRGISRLLGPDQPVYGLEAELDPASAPRDVPGIARRFLDEIAAHQPHGPYCLLGFSLGSFTAYEMGLQLRRRGEDVALLGVFDTAIPNALPLPQYALGQLQRAAHRVRLLKRMKPAERVEALKLIARNVEWAVRTHFSHDFPSEATGVRRESIARNLHAAYAYARSELAPYPGHITAFIAAGSSLDGVDPALDPRVAGWRRLAERVEVRRVPGNHLSMLEPPAVEAVAQSVREALRCAL